MSKDQHVCNFIKTKDGYKCDHCEMFISRDQAAVALSFSKAVFGEVAFENKNRIYRKFDRIVKNLTKRHAE